MGVVSAATTAISVTAPFIIAVIVAAVVSVASLAVVFSFFVSCAAAISARLPASAASSTGFFVLPRPARDFRSPFNFGN